LKCIVESREWRTIAIESHFDGEKMHQPAAPLLHLEHARAPYVIELDTGIIPRLIADVAAGEALGKEIGGLLIGSFPRASTLTLRVEDYVVLERPAKDDLRFVLTVEQRARLSTMRRKLLDEQLRVIGIFRSHRREDKLALSTEDREMIAAEFGRAVHIAFLMRAERPYASALFLPDLQGVLPSGPPIPEFQFNAEETARIAPRATGFMPMQTPQEAALRTKNEARARSLPFWALGAWIAVVVLLCLCLTVWGSWTARALFSGGGLRLAIEQHGNMLELVWNARQTDLSRASSVALTIQDSGVERRIALTPAQIREGRIACQPAGHHVTFRLRIPLSDAAELVQTVEAVDGRQDGHPLPSR
jgi:hypothetical protein